MAREQVGTAPVRPDDTATVSWVEEQLASFTSTQAHATVVGEIPGGNRDGTNPAFTTAFPFVAGTTSVFVNGLREALGLTYTEQNSTTVVLSAPLLETDDIVVSYQRQ